MARGPGQQPWFHVGHQRLQNTPARKFISASIFGIGIAIKHSFPGGNQFWFHCQHYKFGLQWPANKSLGNRGCQVDGATRDFGARWDLRIIMRLWLEIHEHKRWIDGRASLVTRVSTQCFSKKLLDQSQVIPQLSRCDKRLSRGVTLCLWSQRAPKKIQQRSEASWALHIELGWCWLRFSAWMLI